MRTANGKRGARRHGCSGRPPSGNMEACVGAHHLSRRLKAFGHDARLMPAKYVRAFLKGNKNDYRDAEAIAEAVRRPTMRFVATKTAEQLDLQALHRVRSRLVSDAKCEVLADAREGSFATNQRTNEARRQVAACL